MNKLSFRTLLVLALFLTTTSISYAMVYFPPLDQRDGLDLTPQAVVVPESTVTVDICDPSATPENMMLTEARFNAQYHFNCVVGADLEFEVITEETPTASDENDSTESEENGESVTEESSSDGEVLVIDLSTLFD